MGDSTSALAELLAAARDGGAEMGEFVSLIVKQVESKAKEEKDKESLEVVVAKAVEGAISEAQKANEALLTTVEALKTEIEQLKAEKQVETGAEEDPKPEESPVFDADAVQKSIVSGVEQAFSGLQETLQAGVSEALEKAFKANGFSAVKEKQTPEALDGAHQPSDMEQRVEFYKSVRELASQPLEVINRFREQQMGAPALGDLERYLS